MKNLVLIICLLPFLANAKLSNESEVSAVVTGGNSEAEVYNLKTLTKKDLGEKNQIQLGAHYTLGSANKTVSARNWDINARYDRFLQKKLSVFVANQIEGDKFSGIDSRYNADLGVSYFFIKEDDATLKSEVGYRFTREKTTLNVTTKDSKARLYVEGTKKYTDTVFAKMWVEYIPNFSQSGDHLLTLEPSLALTLSKHFSLKLAYKWRYDSLPVVDKKKHDYQYTTALIANF